MPTDDDDAQAMPAWLRWHRYGQKCPCNPSVVPISTPLRASLSGTIVLVDYLDGFQMALHTEPLADDAAARDGEGR